jgi:hypothetical protein
VTASFPASAVLTCWLNARMAKQVSSEEVEDAVRGDDAAHLVTGLTPEGIALAEAVDALVARGALGAVLALPAAGDPVGLAGPAAFNAAALEAAEAVVLAGTGFGLVPVPDTRVVRWCAMTAEVSPHLVGPAEAGAHLRQELVRVTHRLVDLEVASWQPEIPDLLANLRHRTPLPLPRGFNPRLAETLDRAVLCLEIVDLALRDDGGAVTAYEMDQRRGALVELDRAARRALVACCVPLASNLS